jgi:hypothetical protein
MSKMNRDERLAKKWLENIGFQSIIFEPDGNVTPDFLVDNRIAVEVRRLIQNSVNKNGAMKGLEEESIPLTQKIQNLLQSYGPPVNAKSWFICINFERPLPTWKTLKLEIENLVKKLKVSQPSQPIFYYKLLKNFEIDILPTPTSLTHMFMIGGSADGDSGGWVLGELEKNLQLILPEKYKKIEKYKAKYREWWLVLPNYICYEMNDDDVKQFNTYIKFEHSWDKVVLFNPLDVSNWMDF